MEQRNLESLLWLVAVALLALMCYGMYLLDAPDISTLMNASYSGNHSSLAQNHYSYVQCERKIAN
jgi:hypothetical protein